MDADFWRAPYRWPQDPSGYVFVARAVDLVGQRFAETIAGFGEWTGGEAGEFQSNVLRVRLHAAMTHGWVSDPEALKIQKASLTPMEALRRIELVVGWLVRVCERDALPSFVRDEKTGEMIQLKPQFWNLESVYHRFVYGKMSPAQPDLAEIDGEGSGFIFFSRSRLSELLDELTSQTERSSRAMGKKISAVQSAAQALWGGPPPEGLAVKARDAAILRWCRENGHSLMDPRTIRRYFNQ